MKPFFLTRPQTHRVQIATMTKEATLSDVLKKAQLHTRTNERALAEAQTGGIYGGLEFPLSTTAREDSKNKNNRVRQGQRVDRELNLKIGEESVNPRSPWRNPPRTANLD